MATDVGQDDVEHSPLPPLFPSRSLSDPAEFGGSPTFAGRVGSPQSMYFTESVIEEKVQEDGHGRSRSSTFGRAMSEIHRRDTSLTTTTTPTVHGDPSSKIWGLYLSQAEKIDKEQSESWTANTDGVLVFTGLFSAVVATFLVVSYPLLQPSPTDTTNQLLTQISQQLSTNASQPLPSASTSSFQPASSVVRVNVLWFTSLAMSTACALWATLMQQWTRRYMQVADRPYGPPKRARIRHFFADGVEKFALAAAVEVLPGLLHMSVLLFYIGLVDFLININHTVAFFLLAWLAIGCLIYFVLTIMPLFCPNSPYQTPLSSLCWFALEATPLIGYWVGRRKDAVKKHRIRIAKGMRKALESKATPFDVHVDAATHALRWMMRSLDEAHELEEFLDGVPGLFHGSSRHHALGLKERLEHMVKPVADKLFVTCATGLLPEGIRRQRLTACLGAIWCFHGTINLHFRAIWDQWGQLNNDPWGPLSTETWAVASKMTTELDPFIALRAHCIQALMAVMWSRGKWQCAPSEAASLLQGQLRAFSVDIDRWWQTSGNQLQLAIAANLLTNSLQLLPMLDKLVTTGNTMRIEVKAILDTICRDLDASDVPHELLVRFADRAKVMKVYNPWNVAGDSRAFDTDGPWTKVFTTVEID